MEYLRYGERVAGCILGLEELASMAVASPIEAKVLLCKRLSKMLVSVSDVDHSGKHYVRPDAMQRMPSPYRGAQ